MQRCAGERVSLGHVPPPERVVMWPQGRHFRRQTTKLCLAVPRQPRCLAFSRLEALRARLTTGLLSSNDCGGALHSHRVAVFALELAAKYIAHERGSQMSR